MGFNSVFKGLRQCLSGKCLITSVCREKRKILPLHGIMAYGELEVWCHLFIGLIPGGNKLSGSLVDRLLSGERAWSYPLNRRLVGTQSGSGRLEYYVIPCSSREPKHVSSSPLPSHTDYTKYGSRNVSVMWNVFCASVILLQTVVDLSTTYTPSRQRTAAIAVKLSVTSLLSVPLNGLQSSEVSRCVHQLIIRRNWCEWRCVARGISEVSCRGRKLVNL